MKTESEYRIYLDRLKYELGELVYESFDVNTDIEVSWSLFREQLRYWKKEHKQFYEEYLESDD